MAALIFGSFARKMQAGIGDAIDETFVIMSETRKVQLNYPLERLSEPVITKLVTDFDLSPNLIRADVEAGKGGWIVAELSGEASAIDRAVAWVRAQGVGVTEAP